MLLVITSVKFVILVDTASSGNTLLDMLLVITFVNAIKEHFVAVLSLNTVLSLYGVTILENYGI